MFNIGSSRKFNYVILPIDAATRNMHVIIDILHNISSHILNNCM